MARLLRESGVQTVTYSSADEFLGDLKRPLFDCLLLDVDLAEVCGLDLQERLVGDGRRLPTIIITANEDPAERQRAERLGCGAYLRKKVSGIELIQTIRSLIGLGKDTDHD